MRSPWLHRLLMALYPRDFAEHHGDDLLETLRDREAEVAERGTRALWRFRLGELASGVRSAASLRAKRRWERRAPGLGTDLRQALRAVRRRPGLLASVAATAALALAAVTLVYSLVQGVLLRPLPWREPGQLVFVWDDLRWVGVPRAWVSAPQVHDLRRGATLFESVVGLDTDTAALRTASGPPEQVDVGYANAELLDLLGVAPALGPGFRPGDDRPAAAPVAILSHGLWQRRFGGDRGIVGRVIELGVEAPRVVGVLGPDFDFQVHASLGEPTPVDVWMPLRESLAEGGRYEHRLGVLGRIRSGVSLEEAQAQLDALAAEQDRLFYGDNGFRYRAVPLHGDLVARARPALLMLLAAVGAVLLIAAANVATLLLARAQQRRRELAVRAALGAGRGRLARQLVLESTLMCAVGGGLGAALAAAGLPAVLAGVPARLPRVGSISLDAGVLLVALGVTLLTGVLCGLVPALQVRGDLEPALREAGRGGAGLRGAARSRALFVTAQFALALVLVATAGVLLRSFAALQRVDPGFEPAGVLTARVDLPPDEGDYEARTRFFRSVLDRVRVLPGVDVAGGISDLPLAASASQNTVRRRESDEDGVLADWMVATPGALAALGVERLAGRGLAESDRAGAELVVIVDRSLARQLWPGESAVGRTLHFGGEERRVVGVIRQPRQYALEADDRPQLYMPHAQWPSRSLALVVKASARAGLPEALRRSVWDVDPGQPVHDEAPMSERVEGALAARRFALAVLGGFAASAVLLAGIGLYGVMAFSVGAREREFGVRLALGARGRDLLSLVLGESGRIAAVGVLLGAAASGLAARALRSLVWGVPAWDPLTLLVVAGLLGAVAATAALRPARRASRLDPLAALREE